MSDNGREAFVARFTDGWAGGREALAREMEGQVAPDVLLTQPLAPPARGLAGFHAQFERLFRAVPDLTGEVHRWEPTEDGVDIHMTFHGTLLGRPFELPNDDRIVLRDGLLAERHARFDPRTLAAALARPRGDVAAGDRALAALAAGRFVLGLLSRAAPRRTARMFGAGHAATPELNYMTRIFGARAFALGTGYLLSHGSARRLWQRLAFVCDVSDTLAGIGDLRRGEVGRASALAATGLTGTYTAIGGARVARDIRRSSGATAMSGKAQDKDAGRP